MLCYEGDLSDLNRHGWVAEEKWDGTRVKIVKKNGIVTLINRNQIDYTRRLIEIVDAAKAIKGDFTIDTEAVYINPVTKDVEFTTSQRRCSTQDWIKQIALRRQYPITAEAFDVIELYGLDVTKQPYLARKKLLFELLEDAPPEIQYVSFTFELNKAWEDVVRRGAEGLILKDIYSSYEYDRSYRWLKLKNWKHQTVDVAGYTVGAGSRATTFGALVLTKNGKFVGCVGSGFNDWELRQLKTKFDAAPRIPRPFEIDEPWTAVDAKLQVIVKYYKHTENGVFRFPVFERVADQ
jgi:bifunctional non-homologous end joining protein LigD